MFSGRRREQAQALSALCYENPFLPGRLELEKKALGDAYVHVDGAWSRGGQQADANIAGLYSLCEELLGEARRALSSPGDRDPEDVRLYEGLVRYYLFDRLKDLLQALAEACAAGGLTRRRVSSYKLFRDEAARLLNLPGAPLPLAGQLPHLFSILFQLRRAFFLIYDGVVGTSEAATELRGAIWQSIFTSDMGRYERSLHATMDELPTLILGPSGTGKEVVARAIGMARYIPFDDGELRFTRESAASFHALNISALSSGVLEAELFGYRKGAFTGANEDRAGWLETCGDHGCLFLDEIGELEAAPQVKLLRVLQSRTFARVGDTREQPFVGKLVAATNRDLAEAMHAGRFREDLYYRLCADVIETPSLALQLQQRPDDLGLFTRHLLARMLPPEECERAAQDVVAAVERDVGGRYPWPGNVRELEQCVRSVLVRGQYRPARPRAAAPSGVVGALCERFAGGDFDADGLLDAYCTLIYQRTGSYQEAARRLGLDRRTVKSRVDASLLAELS